MEECKYAVREIKMSKFVEEVRFTLYYILYYIIYYIIWNFTQQVHPSVAQVTLALLKLLGCAKYS